MDIIDIDSKYEENKGVRMPENSESTKFHMALQISGKMPTKTDDASLLKLGAGDGITEMIDTIGASITYDDVVEELKSLFRFVGENNSYFDTVIVPGQGLVHGAKANIEAMKEPGIVLVHAAAQRSASREILKVLEILSKQKIADSYRAVREELLELCQIKSKEHGQKLWDELAQDADKDRFKGYNELLKHSVYSYEKIITGFGNGLAERMVIGFRKVVQKFGDDLVDEIASWHDDGLIKDDRQLNAAFNKEMREFTAESKDNLLSLCISQIDEYSNALGKKIMLDFEDVRKKLTATEDQVIPCTDKTMGFKELPAKSQRKDRQRKYSPRKLWNNIKNALISCFHVTRED